MNRVKLDWILRLWPTRWTVEFTLLHEEDFAAIMRRVRGEP